MTLPKKQTAFSIAAVLLASLMISGCISQQTTSDVSAPGGGAQAAKTIRTLTVSGSTTVLPVAQMAAEDFMNTDAGADIQVSGGGSSVGVKSVGEGTVDVGMSSRELKAEEKTAYPELTAHMIAKDGIAMIVHPTNNIQSLTIGTVKGIYDGTYTNWKELGGEDGEIVVIGRDSASGTREFFWEHVMEKGDFTANMLEMNSNGAVKQQVSQTPGAIGYVSLGYIDATVKALNMDVQGQPVEPTVENVLNGKYPVSRPLYLLTSGQASGLAKDYLEHLLGPAGQKLVAEEGFVPVNPA